MEEEALSSEHEVISGEPIPRLPPVELQANETFLAETSAPLLTGPSLTDVLSNLPI